MLRSPLPTAILLGLLSPAALAQFGGLDSLLNRAAKEAQRALEQPKSPPQSAPPQSAPEQPAAPAAPPPPAVPVAAAVAPQGPPRWELEVSYRAALPGAQPPPEIAATFRRARAG